VHSGFSTSSGHYYSYCKNQSGQWFECNDSFVSKTSDKEALSQEAYLLFYQRRETAESGLSTKSSSPVDEVKEKKT
jgi:ubiquitin carboxyl-terminal hydrolase 36/42